jgi:hypothetical protein
MVVLVWNVRSLGQKGQNRIPSRKGVLNILAADLGTVGRFSFLVPVSKVF